MLRGLVKRPVGSLGAISFGTKRNITFFGKENKFIDANFKKIRKMHPPLLFLIGAVTVSSVGILYFYFNCEEYFINNAREYYEKGGGLPNPLPEEHRQEYVSIQRE